MISIQKFRNTLSGHSVRDRSSPSRGEKKADAAEHLVVFHRVGLLTNELPGVSRSAVYLVFRRHREGCLKPNLSRHPKHYQIRSVWQCDRSYYCKNDESQTDRCHGSVYHPSSAGLDLK